MARRKGLTPEQRVLDRLPWSSGEVECLTCGNQWIAVWTIGTDWNKLECPRCGDQHSETGWSEHPRQVH